MKLPGRKKARGDALLKHRLWLFYFLYTLLEILVRSAREQQSSIHCVQALRAVTTSQVRL